MKKEKFSLNDIISLISFPSLFIIMFLIIILNWGTVESIFLNPEDMKSWVSSWGIAAPLFFIGLHIIQVVVFIIPGEVPQIAGGYLFGVFYGSLFSIIGILIGSAINFYLARALGTRFVKAIFNKTQVEKIQKMASSQRAQVIIFILFLIPGIPKDVLTYIAGLSPINFLSFLIISGSGRLPGIIGSTLIGGAVAEKNWVLVIIISIIATTLFFLGYFFKEKIYRLIKTMFHAKKKIT